MAANDMIASKCKKCGYTVYPAVVRCSECKGREFENVKMGDEATIVTFTHLYALPQGIEDYYITLGIVEFPCGARATGQITGPEGSVEMGVKVKPVWGRLRQIGDYDQFGWKFQVM